LSAVIDRRYRRGGSVFAGRGRRTSSPPQFGHTALIAPVQFAQNVHSYTQMNASAPASSLRPHFSQADFISNAIVTFHAIARIHRQFTVNRGFARVFPL
jgi:hypothetical protein